jgi:hypothetical protein
VGDVDVFFVANQTDRKLDRECRFRVGEKTPELWDPETGAIARPAVFRIEGGQLVVPVSFQPRQARLFVFSPGLPERYVTSVACGGTTLFPAPEGHAAEVPPMRFEDGGMVFQPATSGSYRFVTNDGRRVAGAFAGRENVPVEAMHITLALHGPGVADEAPFDLADLRPLSEHTPPSVRYFSGEATYRMTFKVADSVAARGDTLVLDLGGFEAIAEVTLNGQPLGQFWKPGVPIDVTGRLRADNELSVRVITTYRDRLIGDLAEQGAIRHLVTSSPVTDFLSARSPLKPSGLFGPVTLIRVHREAIPGL